MTGKPSTMQRITGETMGHRHTYTPRATRTSRDDDHAHPIKVVNGVIHIGTVHDHTHMPDPRDHA